MDVSRGQAAIAAQPPEQTRNSHAPRQGALEVMSLSKPPAPLPRRKRISRANRGLRCCRSLPPATVRCPSGTGNNPPKLSRTQGNHEMSEFAQPAADCHFVENFPLLCGFCVRNRFIVLV